MPVTKAVKKKFEAHCLSLALVLGLCPVGWNPLDLLVKVWQTFEKNLARRRIDAQSGTDSTWFQKQVVKDPWTVMTEALEAVSETMQLICRVTSTGITKLVKSTKKWLETSPTAKKTIHPWVLEMLIEAPVLEIHALSGICAIAITDLKDMVNKLGVIKRNGDHNDYQMWVFLGRVLKVAMQREISWLHAMEDQFLLAAIGNIPKFGKDKIALLPNSISKDDLLSDKKTLNEAKSSNSRNDMKSLGSTLEKSMEKAMKNVLKQANRSNRRDTPDKKKKLDTKPPRNKKRAFELKAEMVEHVRKEAPDTADEAFTDICCFFAMGEKCQGKKQGQGCVGKKWDPEKKARVAVEHKHKCICGEQHPLYTCDVWHSSE